MAWSEWKKFGSVDVVSVYANSATSTQTVDVALKKGQIIVITLGTNNTAGSVSLTFDNDSNVTLLKSDADSVSPYMLNTYVYKALADVTATLKSNISVGSSYVSYTIFE